MLRGASQVLLLRSEVASAELRRLIPLLSLPNQKSASQSYSAASLVVSTAFTSTLSHSKQYHTRDCPVLAKALPLSRISKEDSFVSRPCGSCVRERVHYLASALFCNEFEERCTVRRNSKSQPTDALGAAIDTSFGSLAALQERVLQFSTSAMTPGRLWVVYSPATPTQSVGRIDLVGLPGCKVPLTHGLWPLAVVNLTEERLCGEAERRAGAGGNAASLESDGQPPAWSHAARVPAASRAVRHNPTGNPASGAVEHPRLSDLQTALARRAVAAMDWGFVGEQLASALAYYNSAERAQTRLSRRKGEEQLAAVLALSRLKDSGAVIHAADSVTISSSTSSTSSPSASSAAEARSAAAASEEASVQTTAGKASTDAAAAAGEGDKTERGAAATATHDTPEVASGTLSSAPPPPSASPDPRPVQLADGTWEYHYANGDISSVLVDGTKKFKTKDLTTTYFTNNDVLYEYPNNTSILDRADGVRVTTYQNGLKTEERVR